MILESNDFFYKFSTHWIVSTNLSLQSWESLLKPPPCLSAKKGKEKEKGEKKFTLKKKFHQCRKLRQKILVLFSSNVVLGFSDGKMGQKKVESQNERKVANNYFILIVLRQHSFFFSR